MAPAPLEVPLPPRYVEKVEERARLAVRGLIVAYRQAAVHRTWQVILQISVQASEQGLPQVLKETTLPPAASCSASSCRARRVSRWRDSLFFNCFFILVLPSFDPLGEPRAAYRNTLASPTR